MRNIFQWRIGNITKAKHDGDLGREVINSNGVSQGSPISALLYITSADGIIIGYKNGIIPKNRKRQNEDKI